MKLDQYGISKDYAHYTLKVVTARGERLVSRHKTRHEAWKAYNTYRAKHPDREVYAKDAAGEVTIV